MSPDTNEERPLIRTLLPLLLAIVLTALAVGDASAAILWGT